VRKFREEMDKEFSGFHKLVREQGSAIGAVAEAMERYGCPCSRQTSSEKPSRLYCNRPASVIGTDRASMPRARRMRRMTLHMCPHRRQSGARSRKQNFWAVAATPTAGLGEIDRQIAETQLEMEDSSLPST